MDRFLGVICTSEWMGIDVCDDWDVMGCLWICDGLCYTDTYVQTCEYLCSCESVLLRVASVCVHVG